MTTRGKIKLFVITAAVAAGAVMAPAARADVLRVCADPDNLPFSKSEGPERGLYVELAELVAKRLSGTVEYVWWLTYNQRRALRNTILDGACDAVFALPADADYKARGLQRTKGFLQVSYALVAPPAFKFERLADLKGKRVGVQVATTPHILLSQEEGYTVASYRATDEVLDALAKGEIDAAMLWGPVAGYENKKRFGSRWQLTPVTGHGLGGQVAVGVRKGQDALNADLDRALVDLQADITGLADKYGFPRGKAVDLDRASSGAAVTPATSVSAQAAVVQTAAPAADTPPAGADAVDEARGRFNSQCSHCHGNNAVTPQRERDLRRLKLRYDEKWRDTAKTTIKNGRSDVGMPAWKELFTEQQIDQLVGFLATIQK